MKKLKLRELLPCLWGLRWTGVGWGFQPLGQDLHTEVFGLQGDQFFLDCSFAILFLSPIFSGEYIQSSTLYVMFRKLCFNYPGNVKGSQERPFSGLMALPHSNSSTTLLSDLFIDFPQISHEESFLPFRGKKVRDGMNERSNRWFKMFLVSVFYSFILSLRVNQWRGCLKISIFGNLLFLYFKL